MIETVKNRPFDSFCHATYSFPHYLKSSPAPTHLDYLQLGTLNINYVNYNIQGMVLEVRMVT